MSWRRRRRRRRRRRWNVNMCERGHTKYIIKARAEVDQSRAAIKKAHTWSVRALANRVGSLGCTRMLLAVGGDGGQGMGWEWDGGADLIAKGQSVLCRGRQNQINSVYTFYCILFWGELEL